MDENTILESEDTTYLENNTIMFDISDLENVLIDRNRFKIGTDEFSELCGKITALVNVGVDPHKALDYISNKELFMLQTSHDKELCELQAKTSIEVAKYDFVNSKTMM